MVRTIIILFVLYFSHANVCSSQDLKIPTGTIHGLITDKESGETLIGANVYIENSTLGTFTDYDGKFSITGIPFGTYSLIVSYLGYTDAKYDFVLNKDLLPAIELELSYAGMNLGAVTITAQAKGQTKAINEQLASNQIINVLSAEKIQELPDANAAETISRLPGVSIQRTGGEGSKVVVRGLSPKYTSMMVEGVNLASSENDRSSDISAISPYSLAGVELIKAITADKDANFVGGLINFKIQEAREGWHSNVILQKGYNQLKNTFSDYLAVGSISNRFFKNKMGVYVQGTLENRNRSSNDQGAVYNVREVDGTKTEIHTSNLLLSDIYRNTKRRGTTFVVDFKLKNGSIFYKNFYNYGNTDISRYNETYDLSNSNRTFGHETYRETYTSESSSHIFNYSQKFGKLSTQCNLSFTKSTKDVPLNYVFLFQQRNAIKSEVLNEIIPPYDLIDYTTSNDTLSYLETINEYKNITSEDQKIATLDITYDWAMTPKIYGNIKVGGKYQLRHRNNDKTNYFGRLRLNSGQQAKDAILNAYPEMKEIVPLGTTSLPFELFSNPNFDHGNFLKGEYTVGAVAPSDLLTDVLDIIKQNVGELEFQTYSLNQYNSIKEDYSGDENLYATYLMSEINIGKKIIFIPGLRYENNTTDYTGPYGDATATAFPDQDYRYIDTTIHRENAFLLPMIHLRLKPTNWLNIRIAYTHTLSRPSYYQFSPRLDILNEAVILNNANLEPEFSKNLDIYTSFYSSKLGLITVGSFFKRIDNMIFSLDRRVILEPEQYDLSSETKGRVIFTQANNSKQATLNGFEFDWQTHFWYLNGFLQGLVLNINYTHIFSKAEYPRTVIELGQIDPVTFKREQYNVDSYLTDRLVDQPDDIFNFQIGYDYKGFSCRLSTLFQSKIFKGTNYYPELVQYTESYNRWDFSMKQALPFKGFKVFINFNNITNAADRSRIVGAPWNTKIQEYGRTIDLGVRYEI